MIKWKVVKLILFSLSAFCSFASHRAMAMNCTGLTSTYSLDVGNILIQRDTPIGQSVSDELTGPAQKITKCTFTIKDEKIPFGMVSSLSYVSSSSNGWKLYDVGIQGVSMAIGGNPHVCKSYFIRQSGFLPGLGRDSVELCRWGSTGIGNSVELNMNPIIQLYKTGPTSSGRLSGQIGSFVVSDVNGGNMQPRVPIYISGTVTTVACAIKTPNIQVPLDDVLASSLTSVGSTAKPKAFNVGLDCDAGTRINAKLTGTQNTDTSAAGVLQLTGAGNANVAKGVGIQILYNGTPMALNNNMVLKTSAGGLESFPFTAQYYQTKAAASVAAGSANATATLELTYQ